MTISSSATNGNLTSIKFSSPNNYDNRVLLSEGQNVEIMDYFNLTFNGWRDLNTTSISALPISGISSSNAGTNNLNFLDNESEAVSVAIGGIKNADATGARSYKTTPITLLTPENRYVFDFAGVNVTGEDDVNNTIAVRSATDEAVILHYVNGTNFTATTGFGLLETSGARYNISYIYDATANKYTSNMSLIGLIAGNSTDLYGNYKNLIPQYASVLGWNQTATQAYLFHTANSTIAGTLKIVENDGASSTIEVSYENNAVNSVKVVGQDLSSDNQMYSGFGSMVARTGGSVQVTLPQTRRYANVWVGRSATETKNVAVGEEIDGDGWTVEGASVSSSGGVTPIVPGVGRSDVEYSSPVSLTKPTIVIGGGNANKLTAELATNAEGVSTADLVAANNRAYIELIENAFGGSQTVLVVAGRDAKDTKVACQALAAHVLGTKTLSLAGTTAWLDTTSSNYNSVSVIAE